MELITKRELNFVSLVEAEFTQPKELRRRSHWLINTVDEAILRKLKDNMGQPLLIEEQPEDESGKSKLRLSMLRYPVKFGEVRPGDVWFGADGEYVVLRIGAEAAVGQ